MKKVLKTLRGLSLGVVILLIVIVVAIHFFAGLALRVGIEKAATKTLSVEVSVSDVDLSLLRWLFKSLSEMSDVLGYKDSSSRWNIY